jgi:hypothetical protein
MGRRRSDLLLCSAEAREPYSRYTPAHKMHTNQQQHQQQQQRRHVGSCSAGSQRLKYSALLHLATITATVQLPLLLVLVSKSICHCRQLSTYSIATHPILTATNQLQASQLHPLPSSTHPPQSLLIHNIRYSSMNDTLTPNHVPRPLRIHYCPPHDAKCNSRTCHSVCKCHSCIHHSSIAKPSPITLPPHPQQPHLSQRPSRCRI